MHFHNKKKTNTRIKFVSLKILKRFVIVIKLTYREEIQYGFIRCYMLESKYFI